jgi:hypothetical protein
MIVTLEMMKLELGISVDAQDDMLMQHIDNAEAIVLDYIKVDSDTYTDGTGQNDFPVVIGAAVVMVARSLFEKPDADPITVAVQNVLHRQRTQAMA